jgi:hypothetical protein
MDAIGGYGAGAVARRKENTANTEWQQQFAADQADRAKALAESKATRDADAAYRAQELDVSRQQLGVTQRGAGINPLTGQPFPYTMDPALKQIVAKNGGKAPTPEQVNAHFNGLINDALRQNRPDLADFYRQQATDYSTLVYSGGLKVAQAGEAGARTTLDQARAKALGTQQATLLAIARGHDATAIQKAGMQFQNAREIAQYTGAWHTYIANLAGAYRLAGNDQNNAIKLAIDKANNQVRTFGYQANALNPETPPPGLGDPGTGGTNAGPTINYILPGAEPSTLPTPPWQQPANGAQPGAKPPSTAPVVDQTMVNTILATTKGHSRAEIQAALQSMQKAGRISAELAHAVWAKVPPDTPPVPVGGARTPPGAASPQSPFPAYLR